MPAGERREVLVSELSLADEGSWEERRWLKARGLFCTSALNLINSLIDCCLHILLLNVEGDIFRVLDCANPVDDALVERSDDLVLLVGSICDSTELAPDVDTDTVFTRQLDV